ncbi:MAG: TonB-dependent receptor domain-containing protein [Oceanococcaceae bacterium]
MFDVRNTSSLMAARAACKPYLWACVAMLMSAPAQAAELLVYTFLDARPFSGLTVELDGQRLGKTDDEGRVRTDLTAGAHVLRTLKDGAELSSSELITAAGESAEVSIAFSDFQSAPKVSIATYDHNNPDPQLSGEIRGQIVDSAGQGIAAATVSVGAGLPSTSSDAQGRFALKLPRGNYRIEVSRSGYEDARGGPVRVVANIGVATSITMRAQASDGAEPVYTADDFADVEEVEVVGTFNPTEDTADLEKFSVAITDSISIDDLLRFGDSDVAAALKRIVGVSVTGGKYANVRGLDGRYISSTLNGSLMPSTDPFRRDVQLDLFPSEILGGIEIQKSFTSDLPGDTTGGIIRMSSRDMPRENEAGISLSLGYVNGVTGEALLSYAGSGSDDWTFDDGERELPGDYRAVLSNGNYRFRICQFEGQQDCISQAEGARLAGLLPVVYQPGEHTAEPNLGLAAKYGRYQEKDSGNLGYYGSLTYDRGYSSRQDARFDSVDDVGERRWDSFETSLNAYGVIGWEDARGWSLSSKTIVLRDAEDRVTVDVGLDKVDETNERTTILEWVERQFLGQQLEGAITLFGNHELNWRGGLTQTKRYSPDRREYQYRNNVFIAPTLERSYAELIEDGLDFGLDYRIPIAWNSYLFTNLRMGALWNSRERDNELIRLGVLQRDSSLDTRQDIELLLSRQAFIDDQYRLNTNKTTETDSYEASQDTTAFYLSSETDLGVAFTIVAGVRMEDYSVDLNYPNDSNEASSLNSDRDSSEVLPSLGLIYRFSDAFQLRGGFAQTVSRPNITELADTRFYDQEGRQYIGCPNCSDSEIDNFDLRGEYYFNGNDSISLALFYKAIDNPLERAVSDGSGSAVSALTFRNSDAATVQGIELDGAKRIWDGIDNTIDISGNIALIESDIALDADGRRLEGISSRELQGQSPFLANLQIALDNYEWDMTGTLVINYFDDRIDTVSRAPLEPIYESGRVDVNLTADKSFRNGSKVSLKIKNLLDAAIERTQNGRVIDTYKKGVSISLGLSYDF